MSKLIYVVDDESNIRTMMQLFLENEGFTVETFKDGQEACQAFSAKEPDMLILDIMMPGIDGLSLCTYFRRQSHVPIIFVSAKDTPLDRVMGITLGSDDYITKPFLPLEFVAQGKGYSAGLIHTFTMPPDQSCHSVCMWKSGSFSCQPQSHNSGT